MQHEASFYLSATQLTVDFITLYNRMIKDQYND